MPIEFSLDRKSYSSKPTGKEPGRITNTIGNNRVAVTPVELPHFLKQIGEEGKSFSPATFDGKRSQDNFNQQQLFALDFDNDPEVLEKKGLKMLTPEECLDRANQYNLPIQCIYRTLSSTDDQDRFRVILLNDAPVGDKNLAYEMNRMLGKIFPETDPSCYSDISKFYYGGNKVLYQNEDPTKTISVEKLFGALVSHFMDTKGPKKYREAERDFWEKGKTGKPEIVTCDASELDDALSQNVKGGNLPTPTILRSNIGHGIIPPTAYIINYIETSNTSISLASPAEAPDSSTAHSAGSSTPSHPQRNNYHKAYRSSTLKKIYDRCGLYRDFKDGKENLDHDELWGLATNIRLVESGIKEFIRICDLYPHLHYHDNPGEYWGVQIKNIPDHYKPKNCTNFCRYSDSCDHRKNILLTAAPQRNTMERIPGYEPDLLPLKECEKETYTSIREACNADDSMIHVINSMTAIGKTRCYLDIMRSGGAYLVATPTNILKQQVFQDAKKLKIPVMMTPSLDEIADEIPNKVWRKIQKLRRNGKHNDVSPYIIEVLKKKNIPCLRKYLDDKAKLQTFNGSIISTHRYLLVADHNLLQRFNAIIVDEDILFKAIIMDHVEVSAKRLRKLLTKKADKALRKKIQSLLKSLAEMKSQFIKLPSVNWEDDEENYGFDVDAFCRAKSFYVDCKTDDPTAEKDSVYFINSPVFHTDLTYVVVSATAEESLYCSFFGEDRIDFTMCHRAQYRGKLKQYYGLSMSRTCLNDHAGLLDYIQKYHHIPASRTLTYKGYASSHLYYGNLEGINDLKGEDLLIAGSAYQKDFVYILAAAALGFDIPEDTSLRSQTVEHNGYTFNFMTFDDPDLRQVQFWMIESELEQAVGRARLLREDCTVYYYGNFPLHQAQMINGYEIYGDFLHSNEIQPDL